MNVTKYLVALDVSASHVHEALVIGDKDGLTDIGFTVTADRLAIALHQSLLG